MTTAIDHTGQKFGLLTVIRIGERDKQNIIRWHCVCECGGTILTRGSALRCGKSKSCGCMGKKNLLMRTTHGLSESPEWRAWKHMKQRCNDPSHRDYHNYGGRGIAVSIRWMKSFENFYADMGERPSAKHSLERKNNSLGYTGHNCKWALPEEQGNNKRNSRLFTHNGETMSLAQWGRKVGIPRNTLFYRLDRGLSFADAIK